MGPSAILVMLEGGPFNDTLEVDENDRNGGRGTGVCDSIIGWSLLSILVFIKLAYPLNTLVFFFIFLLREFVSIHDCDFITLPDRSIKYVEKSTSQDNGVTFLTSSLA